MIITEYMENGSLDTFLKVGDEGRLVCNGITVVGNKRIRNFNCKENGGGETGE